MSHATIDWRAMLVPTGSLPELIVRGSLMYRLILAGFRVFRRDAGSLSVSDLLVVVLIADAAQNGMAGEYKSVTEGVVVVATIFAWNYALDGSRIDRPSCCGSTCSSLAAHSRRPDSVSNLRSG
jgi:hypothetical protein